MIAALCLALLANDFERAAEAYEAGRFAEARALFEAALEDAETPEGPTYYNLGHCAFHTGEHAEAVLFYTAAIERLPDDPAPSLARNLARRELGLKPLPPPPPDPFARFDALSGATRLGVVGGLQLIALLGFFASKRRASRVPLAVILLVAWTGAFHLVKTELDPAPSTGVVLAEKVSVRPDPHTNLAILFELRAGELVTIEEHSSRWARITHERGDGWVERAGVAWAE